MRHCKAFRKLSRDPVGRHRLLCNLVTQLFEHEQIKTTMARAKELRRVADKVLLIFCNFFNLHITSFQLVTLAKRGTETSQLKVFEQITKPEVGTKLITELNERYKDRSGGYTRLWNAGLREGDRAPIAIVELVDGPFDLRKYFDSKLNEVKL